MMPETEYGKRMAAWERNCELVKANPTVEVEVECDE